MNPRFLRILSALSIAALLFGCGGAQTIAPTLPQAIRTQTHHGKSWMLPEAKTEDLLYVSVSNSDFTQLQTDVYAYKTKKLVGTLAGVESPAWLCADTKGNIFVSDEGATSEMVVYEHGHLKPKRTVPVPQSHNDCAVAPTSGNLAVAGQYGNIYVYRHGAGTPESYTFPKAQGLAGCSYDDSGNLFVVAWNQNNYGIKDFLYELPKGSGIPILLRLHAGRGGPDVKWDGKHITVLWYQYIYRLLINGNRGVFRGRTRIGGESNTFWFVPGRHQVVSSDGERYVNFNAYPGGKYLGELNLSGENFNPVVSLVNQ